MTRPSARLFIEFSGDADAGAIDGDFSRSVLSDFRVSTSTTNTAAAVIRHSNRRRSDKGRSIKIHLEAVKEAIDQVLPQFHGDKHNKTRIYRACIERGLLRREEIAPNTFSRMVKRHEMLKPLPEVKDKRRLAFCKKYANQMWQADTMVGPYVADGNKRVQAHLIAFMDDASRTITHGEFFIQENTDAMIKCLRTALYKRGVPEQIYVDNGAIYTCQEIILICARIGIILSHTPMHDARAKGKIERCFGTVRGSFLCRHLDLSSIDALNRQFNEWVEEDYNAKVHSIIHMKPIDRFGLDLPRIQFLPPNQISDELFYFEADRRVKADNTFSLKNIRFEAPRDKRKRKIQVRFDRHKISRVVVYCKGERMGEAKPLNPVDNNRPPKALMKGDWK